MTRCMVLGIVAGCAGAPPTASFLRLRGEVAPEVTLRDDPIAVIVWVTAADGELCVETELPLFEPSLFEYEVEIDGPPSLSGEPCVPWPADLAPPGPVAAGVLVLADVADPSFTVTADPTTLLGWVGSGEPPLDTVLLASGARLAGVAQGFLLGVARDPGPFGPSFCRLDGLLAGLTLYEDRGVDCAGWHADAPAGVRTEFQGVDLAPL